MNLPAAILSGVTDHREPKPRSAMCIAVLIYGKHASEHMASVVFELERLEAEGMITSSVDAGSVKRWTLVAEEQGAAMELGAEIMLRKHFTPTVDQRQHMGFNA